MKYRKSQKHRQPTGYEAAVVEHLLAASFPGRDQLRRQFKTSTVSLVSDYGAGSHVRHIYFDVDPTESAPVSSQVPVRGTAVDEDGVPIDYILSVKPDGLLEALEIVKADGTPIKRMAD